MNFESTKIKSDYEFVIEGSHNLIMTSITAIKNHITEYIKKINSKDYFDNDDRKYVEDLIGFRNSLECIIDCQDYVFAMELIWPNNLPFSQSKFDIKFTKSPFTDEDYRIKFIFVKPTKLSKYFSYMIKYMLTGTPNLDQEPNLDISDCE